jgi:signal transduction histidine kinase
MLVLKRFMFFSGLLATIWLAPAALAQPTATSSQKIEALRQEMEYRLAVRTAYLTGFALLAVLGFVLVIYLRQNQRIAKLEAEKRLADIARINSHDVRSPVASILGLLELAKMSDNKLDPQSLIYLEQLARHLDKVIREIVNKAHLEHQQMRSERERAAGR